MKTLQSYRGFLINEQTKSGDFNSLPGTSDNIKALAEHIKTGMKNKPATIKLNLSLPPNLTKDQSSVDYILSIEGVGYSKDKGVPCIFFPLKFSKPSGGGELPDVIKESKPAITVKIGDKNFSQDDWSKNKKLFSFTFRLENDQDYRQYPGDKACEGLFKLMLDKKIFEDIGKGGDDNEEGTKGEGGASKEKSKDSNQAILNYVEQIFTKYKIKPENIKWGMSEGKRVCTLRLTTERGLLSNAEGDILIMVSEKPSVLKINLNGVVKPCSVIFRRRYNNEGLFKKVFGEKFVDEKFKSEEVFPLSDKQSKKADQIIASAGIDSLVWKTVQNRKVFNVQLPFGPNDSEPKMGYTVVSMDDLDLAQIEKIIKVLDKN
jgi:hypothetical protein